jgi:Z1 domain
MLIHPARERDVHRNSVRWAIAIKDGWKAALDLPLNDPDRKDVVAEFKNAYDDLLKTASNLPPFDSIIEKLPRALRNTTVIEFNTNGRPKTPEINWRHFEGWILVGGQAVDRGFTVDSLSVTYMPRGIGVGNADTVQQRARFFGYKKRYLGLCRVYLEQNLIDAFEGYVEHEQIMRGELQTLSGTGDNLQKWRRRLVLDPALHPCRRSVISDPYMRQRAGGGWTQQRGALIAESSRQANIATLVNLVANLKFVADDTYASKEAAQKHEIARDVPAQSIIEALAEYKLEDPRDTASFTGILLTLGEAIRSNPNITATIYKMRPTAGGRRDIKDDGTIENFLQGRTDRPGGYPGDTFYQQPNQMTLQLHAYDLRQNSKVVAKAAPLVVFHVPSALAKDWLIQVQAGQQ